MSARKVRPCKTGCGYPALSGRQFCRWHALLRLSSIEQAQAATARRESALGHDYAVFQARVPKDRWPDGERWCAGCQSFVPLFYSSGSRCKACASQAAHAGRVEKTYGITAEQYDEILERQGGVCAICGNKSRSIRFAVDHDHQTGEVRGLLCKRCNHDLLGGGHDSVDLLFKALAYLLFPTAECVDRPTNDQALAALAGYLEQRAVMVAPPGAQVCFEPPPF